MENKLLIRLCILSAVCIVGTALLIAALYGLQTSDYNAAAASDAGRAYYSERVSVPAARGEIYDRYGRPLVTNILIKAIKFDSSALRLLDNKSQNAGTPSGSAVVYDLINLLNDYGLTRADELPVSYAPYRYTGDETLMKRLTAFIKTAELPADITSEELMAKLKERYAVPRGLTRDEERAVIGVRWSAEIRETQFTIPAYILTEGIPDELAAIIAERGYGGVSLTEIAGREYRTDFAAHLLGRTGKIRSEDAEAYAELGYPADATVGIGGIEQAAENQLRGRDGEKRVEFDRLGQTVNETWLTEAVSGSNVFASIDIRFQEAAERALARGIYKLRQNKEVKQGSQASAGAAVVIDVKTGEVLAMASYPTYSLKDFQARLSEYMNDPLTPMLNRAIAGAYEPGSTFKMCTGLAALESGIITPKTKITDRGRYMYYAPSYTPSCLIYSSSGRTHGSISVGEALKVSCNYFFYEVGRLTGINNIDAYAANFGLGQPSGFELDGERTGSLAGPEYAAAQKLSWNPGDTIQAAIGQSYNNFTPLQLAVYTATIANGGTRYRPHIIKSVVSHDFRRSAFDISPEALYEFGFAEENIGAVQAGMRMVAQTGGTGAATFAAYPIEVACKTGTAQISSGRPDNGVFVGYAPYSDPEIAVAVVVEKGAGGSRIAPIARDLFDAYFEIKERS